MKKTLTAGLALSVLCATLAAGALQLGEASPIVYNIDQVISGDGVSTGWDFGTATLSDSGSSVQLSVTLSDPGWKLHSVYLNYDDVPPFDVNFTLSTGDSITYGLNKPGEFKSDFDLQINGPNGKSTLGALGFYTTLISLGQVDLDPEDFNIPSGGVYMAFHIGALEKDLDGDESVWAGATAVPIPGALLLFASGLLALRLVRRIEK